MSHDQKPTRMRIVATAGVQGRRTGDPAESGVALAPDPRPADAVVTTGGTRTLGLVCFLLFVGGSGIGAVALSMARLS